MLWQFYLVYTTVTRVPHMPTLSDAIAAIKEGRPDEGRVMLGRILATDRNNVTALLWMTEVAATPEEVRIYLNGYYRLTPTMPRREKGLSYWTEPANRYR
jgi:hypothetical protein